MKPQTFAEWWRWGLEQADASRRVAPPRLHQEAFPPDSHPGKNPESELHGLLGGPPFTVPFQDYLDAPEVYLDAKILPSPLRRAMARLYNPKRVQSHEYRILHALISGHTDAEVVRAAVGGCRREFFEVAAVRALDYAFERINSELPAPEPLTYRDASVRSTQQSTRRGRVLSPASPIGTRSYRHAQK